MAVLEGIRRALRGRARITLVAAIAAVGLAGASTAQAAPKPKMSFAQANKVAVQKAMQATARDKLAFPAKAASAGALSWQYGCRTFGWNLAQYWNLSRWYRGHDVSQGEIGPDDSPYGIQEFVYSWRRASTWWRCNTKTVGMPQDTGIFYIRLREEVAGSDAGGISGSQVACEVLYDFSQSIVGREPAGCALGV